MREKDIAIWKAAKPYLDVRNNDEHTLHVYTLGQQLIEQEPEANADIILPSILLHDTGWKMIPQDKVLQAFGPNRKYPELQRQHELESVKIATGILENLGYSSNDIQQINAIIDGHDTTAEQRSINDGIMKDADKLWRYTPHGICIIAEWFGIDNMAVIDILVNFVRPQLLRKDSGHLADSLIRIARLKENMSTYLN
ncbi:MAG: HD domain-containing protein [Bacteroidetes bacterium]|nr:HD domain-containing protein [Bacteroidota bacterium]